MSRPYSWYPLATFDPVPGDPATVRAAGDEYAVVARAIELAAARLRQIADLSANRSDAVTAVSEQATTVADEIDRARERYATVGRVLGEYAWRLDRAQADSVQALHDAQNAEHALTSAQDRVWRTTSAVDDAPADADLVLLGRALTSAREDRADAEHRLAAAREALAAAVQLRDQAGDRAADAIRDAVRADGLRDSWWDDWGSQLFHAVSDVAGAVASIVGILALVLCWVPVIGQALAVVAAIATAIKLIADLVLWMNDEATLEDLGWDVFDLVTFGAGRVLSTAAHSTSTAASAIGRLEAGRAAALSVDSRVAMGLPTGSSATTIRELVGLGAGTMSKSQAGSIARVQGGRFLPVFRRRDTWACLSPGAMWADVVSGSKALSVPELTTLFRQGAANFTSARGSTSGMVAVLQGEAPMVKAALATSEIQSSLINVSSATAQAITSSRIGLGSSATVTAIGVYDTIVGVESTSMWMRGRDAPLAITAPFQAVFAPADSPAQRLQLAQ